MDPIIEEGYARLLETLDDLQETREESAATLRENIGALIARMAADTAPVVGTIGLEMLRRAKREASGELYGQEYYEKKMIVLGKTEPLPYRPDDPTKPIDTQVCVLDEEGKFYDAICETRSCLPDAVQLLTPCTTGNGWLKIVPFGKFALTLYDKTDEPHKGVRVYLDAGKLKDWPEIYAWFFKLKPKAEQDRAKLTEEIRQAGTSILTVTRVSVKDEFAKKAHKGQTGVCPQCGEAYPLKDGETCLACQGNMVYV